MPSSADEMPWDEMPAALELLRNRHAGGKIALTIGG